MSKSSIPQEPAYSGYAYHPYKNDKGKKKVKKPSGKPKQTTGERHSHTSRGH